VAPFPPISCIHSSSRPFVLHALLIFLDLIILIILGEQCELWSCSLCSFSFLQPRVASSLWDHPTLQQSTGVGIQATTRYIYVLGNLTICYHVWLHQFSIVSTQRYKYHDNCRIKWSEVKWNEKCFLSYRSCSETNSNTKLTNEKWSLVKWLSCET
jgi:hypothetical protein